jgi:hydrogenase maturation protein HypF
MRYSSAKAQRISTMIERIELQIRGIVQGVGFRPFVYGLAQKHALKGRVRNNEAGVLIDIEGERGALDQFISDLQSQPPGNHLGQVSSRRG